LQTGKQLRETVSALKLAPEALAPRVELEGLLGGHELQAPQLDFLSSVIMADESLLQKFAEHYNVPVNLALALFVDHEDSYMEGYVIANLTTVTSDLSEPAQRRQEQLKALQSSS